MIIRNAFMEDIPALVEAAGEYCEEMGFQYDPETCADTCRMFLERGAFFKVCEEDGEPLGLGMAMIFPSFLCKSDKRAIETALHSKPSLPPYKRMKIMLALIQEMEHWADAFNVPLKISVNSDKSGSLKRCLGKRGYIEGETVMSRGRA